MKSNETNAMKYANDFYVSPPVTCAFAVIDRDGRIIRRSSCFFDLPYANSESFARNVEAACNKIRASAENNKFSVAVVREICRADVCPTAYYCVFGPIDADAERILCLSLDGCAGVIDDTPLESDFEAEGTFLEKISAEYFRLTVESECIPGGFNDSERAFLCDRTNKLWKYAPELHARSMTSVTVLNRKADEIDLAVLIHGISGTFNNALYKSGFSLTQDSEANFSVFVKSPKFVAAAIICGINLLLKVTEKKAIRIKTSLTDGSDSPCGIPEVSVVLYCPDEENSARVFELMTHIAGSVGVLCDCLANAGAEFKPFADGSCVGMELRLTQVEKTVRKRLRFLSGDETAETSEVAANTDAETAIKSQNGISDVEKSNRP